MPKATTIVVHFDDGTTYEIPADGTGSIFLNEGKAAKCGHKPPYKKPPKRAESNGSSGAEVMGLMSTSDATSDTSKSGAADEPEMQAMEGACFIINGVIVCP